MDSKLLQFKDLIQSINKKINPFGLITGKSNPAETNPRMEFPTTSEKLKQSTEIAQRESESLLPDITPIEKQNIGLNLTAQKISGKKLTPDEQQLQKEGLTNIGEQALGFATIGGNATKEPIKKIIKEKVKEINYGLLKKITAKYGQGTAAKIIDTGGEELAKKTLEKEGEKIVTEQVDPFRSTVNKLIQSIKEAKPIRAETEKLYTAERSLRAGKGAEILKTPGEEGYIQALGALKGELPKPQFEGLRTTGKITQEEVDLFFDKIKQSNLSFYDKISASTGLAKVLDKIGGQIPTASELKKLENIFGDDLVKTILDKRSSWEKIKETLADFANVPRALVSSIDMSAALRQGRILATYKPKQWGSAFKEMFSYWGNIFKENPEKFFEEAMNDIAKRPTFKIMEDSGLYLTDLTESGFGLSGKEERFMSNLAEKIPLVGRNLVKPSERAYVGFLNKARADVFDDIANQYIKGGITPENDPEIFKSLANFINTISGRGNMPKALGGNASVPALNAVFFSPKFLASRIQLLNPAWYIKQPAPVRKEAMKSILGFVGSGLSLLGLAKLGGAEVEADPRSTDFGKIKIGNTRYDVWAG